MKAISEAIVGFVCSQTWIFTVVGGGGETTKKGLLIFQT